MHSDLEYFSYVTGSFSFGSLQNFLTNKPSRFRSAFPGLVTPRGLRQNLSAGYGQDDWRVLPNLTLNWGLRYEMTSVPTEVNGKLSTLTSLTSSQNHLGNPLFQNPTRLNFEPRVGLSWDPGRDGRTAHRAAFGVHDVLPVPYQFQSMETRAAPFFRLGSASKLPAGSFSQGALGPLTPTTPSVSWVE